MNTKNIQPIQSWFPNQGTITIDTLSLTDFYHYHFDDGGGKVSYSLLGTDVSTLSPIVYFSDNINIPSNIIEQWGADDTIIWNYVATTLGLIII